MVGGGPVDVVTGDYLAEVTMLVLAKVRARRPGGGYATTFLRQLEPVAAQIADRGIKVVVNAGGLDPAGLAEATCELLARIGVDLVVTGRVADASLVSGVAAWWWGWTPGDHDALAGAVVAGHVIECGAQATGGNFSGFREIADLTHPGFPLAEIGRDGSSVITKHPGAGGAVTVDTVTAQLLYEVDGPGYLNPDVVARLDTVRLEPAGTDRVRIGGVAGLPPPPTTKLAVTGLGGWRNAATLVLTGLDVDAKSALAEAAVRARLDGVPGITDLRFDRIGVAAVDPEDQLAGSCLLRVSVDGDEASAGRAFSSALVELALANYPGMYGMGAPGAGSSPGAYWPALVPQAILQHTVVHADGRRQPVPPPAVTAPLSAATAAAPLPAATAAGPSPAATAPAPAGPRGDFGPTVEGPLGRLVHARSEIGRA